MKIVFIQNKGGNYGGVWQVNKMVGEALINKGYEVSIVSIRDDHFGLNLEHDPRLNVVTINEKDIWHTYYGSDFKDSLKKFKLITLFKQVFHRIRNIKRLKNDKKNLTKYLDEYKPDYLVVSQYQVLDLIDTKYLPITFMHQHASFMDTLSVNANVETFFKYNDKIKGFIWLTKHTMAKAIEKGFKNNHYIYNAVRFNCDKVSDVINNKKLVSISRLSSDKRIDLMIEMVEEVFKDPKYQDWSLEIYGDGEESDNLSKIITSPQVKLMGSTDKPMDVMLSSSINLNTSTYEGFCLTIIEGYECGVPSISFNSGEQIEEVIIDHKTGFIAKDREDYINKLKELMDNSDLLKEMGLNSKEYNKNFQIDKIVNDWDKLFNNVK
jgi:glycosyltransferase involved in cell wall biosynthesis